MKKNIDQLALNPFLVWSLFRKKRFMFDEMFQRNTSKFAIFLEYKNPRSFFRFSFRATLFFSLMHALVYVDIKKLRGFSYSKNMAILEAFHWNISSSINLLFLKNEIHSWGSVWSKKKYVPIILQSFTYPDFGPFVSKSKRSCNIVI